DDGGRRHHDQGSDARSNGACGYLREIGDLANRVRLQRKAERSRSRAGAIESDTMTRDAWIVHQTEGPWRWQPLEQKLYALFSQGVEAAQYAGDVARWTRPARAVAQRNRISGEDQNDRDRAGRGSERVSGRRVDRHEDVGPPRDDLRRQPR